MAFVYWIWLKEHTDIFTEGYVGITSKTVSERYRLHVVASKKKDEFKKYRIAEVISERYDDIVVDTICECSIEYAGLLENKLRPFEKIGWNTAKGGNTVSMTEEGRLRVSKALKGVPKNPELIRKMNEVRLSTPVSKETREKISKSLLGIKRSEETRMKLSNSHKTRTSYVRTDAAIEKHVKTYLNKHPLDLPNINFSVWLDADFYYERFLEGLSVFQAAKIKGISKGTLRAMWKRFKLGFIPLKDERWVEFRKDNLDNVG